jgi:hypothetical protein
MAFPSVMSSVILTEKVTRHHTDLVFESLGDSVGILNGEPITSPYGLSF